MELDRVLSLTPRHHQSLIKQLCERLLAFVLLAACSPLLLVLMLAVRLTSPGPALLRQQRVGLRGKPFLMYKLRSMVANAESASGAVWAAENDPRVTPLGRVLRQLHLDELPQLANIVAGDMSFVGPRPERPMFVEQLSAEIPGYVHRLAVRPGVTGLAQVNLSPDQTMDCVRRKLELDLHYVFLGGWDVDLRIVVCTLLKIVGIPRTAAARMMLLSIVPVVAEPAAPIPPAVPRERRQPVRTKDHAQRRPASV